MNLKKLSALRQAKIQTPCPETWENMDGDDKKRFCSGCGCHVHNLEQFSALEAEALITSGESVCTRMKVDVQKGILTRDGWVPRMLLAGAVAASMAGCAVDVTSDMGTPMTTEQQVTELGEMPPAQRSVTGKLPPPDQSGQVEELRGKICPTNKPKPVSKKPVVKKSTSKKRGSIKKQTSNSKPTSNKKKPGGK